jgi:hypothetical protein
VGCRGRVACAMCASDAMVARRGLLAHGCTGGTKVVVSVSSGHLPSTKELWRWRCEREEAWHRWLVGGGGAGKLANLVGDILRSLQAGGGRRKLYLVRPADNSDVLGAAIPVGDAVLALSSLQHRKL